MSVFKIRFHNNGSDTNFTLCVASPPVFRRSSGSPIGSLPIQSWSNSFITKTIPRGAIDTFTINSAPLALCGTSSTKPLAAGTAVNMTMIQHATVGDHSSGSTHLVYNNNASPAFREDERYDAPPRAYGITTNNDFGPNLKWVGGYGLFGNGQPRPAATFTIDPEFKYTVFPGQAPKFYLCNLKLEPETLVDPKSFPSFAEIDFAQHPDENNAVVTLDAKGIYHVDFMAPSMFAMRATSLTSDSQDLTAQLTQLKHQIKIMSDLIDNALGVSAPADIGANMWACSFRWTQNIPNFSRNRIASLLDDAMKKRGYELRNQNVRPDLTMYLSHTAQDRESSVYLDWIMSWSELPPDLQLLLANPKVEKIFFNQSSTASSATLDIPEVTLPVLHPQYECSVEWLEGPSEDMKRVITGILANGMKDQNYYTFMPKSDDKTLVIPVWHLNLPSDETVRAAWEKSIKLLHKIYLGNYVGNAKVEGIVYADDDGATTADQTVNSQNAATILAPFDSTYYCSLTWLEGPDQLTKHSIASKLIAEMNREGYLFQGRDLGGENLSIVFSKQIRDRQIVFNDWNAARNALGFQIMYTTNPQVDGPFMAADGDASTSSLPVMPPTYVCSWIWLEGANRATQLSILSKLIPFLAKRGYYAFSPTTNDKGASIFFSHDFPHDLPAAQADFSAARDSLGTQRMYMGNAKCENAMTIQAGNVSLSDLNIDDGTAPTDNAAKNGANGANGKETNQATGVETQTQVLAPEVQFSAMVPQESIEEKKRRALALLQAEGLVGFGGALQAA